jgi:hypothetical protein
MWIKKCGGKEELCIEKLMSDRDQPVIVQNVGCPTEVATPPVYMSMEWLGTKLFRQDRELELPNSKGTR